MNCNSRTKQTGQGHSRTVLAQWPAGRLNAERAWPWRLPPLLSAVQPHPPQRTPRRRAALANARPLLRLASHRPRACQRTPRARAEGPFLLNTTAASRVARSPVESRTQSGGDHARNTPAAQKPDCRVPSSSSPPHHRVSHALFFHRGERGGGWGWRLLRTFAPFFGVIVSSSSLLIPPSCSSLHSFCRATLAPSVERGWRFRHV